MTPAHPSPPAGANEEISALIEVLQRTEQRLAELTAGEVDSVTGWEGRPYLLQHAQEQLRHSEAAKQAAILDSLPASIALLDPHGIIISVNEAWRRFADANTPQSPGYGIGINYLDLCDSARGEGAAEAQQAAACIRSVLAGEAKIFSLEYACHSPTEQRWFLMTISPQPGNPPHGAVVMHLNITERKQAEENMKFFRTLLDNSSDAIEVFDPVTLRILDVNETECRDLGYSREELLSLKVTDIDSMLNADLKRKIEEQIRQSGSARFESVHRRKDGSTFPVEVSAKVVTLDKPYALNIVRNITERKQIEQKLRESESRFNEIADNIRDGFFLLTADGTHMLYISQAYETIWGQSRENLYANSEAWLAAIHPDDQASTYEKYQQGLLVGKAELEFRIVRPDGSIRWVAVSAFPVCDKAGKIVRIAGLATDITERKHLELDKEQYLKFFMLSINPMCIADPYGCFKLVNPAFVQLTGYSESELIAKPFLDFVLPEDRQRTVDEMKLQVENRPTLHFDNRYLCKNGSVIDLSWNSYYDKRDGITYATAIDITERKTVELALQKNKQQLTEALTIAKIGYWEYEYATDEFVFDDQYYSLHKITAEEAGGYRMSSGDFVSRYVYPEDAPNVGQHVRLAFETRDPDYFAKTEARILTGEGEIVWVEVRMRIQKDLQGNTIKLIGVNQNITERKHAEEKVRQLSLAVEQSPSAIAITDLKANIEYVNEGFVNTTGYSRAELVGQNPRILHSGKTPRARYVDMWAHLTSGKMWKGEFINRRKDGSEYIESVLMSPVRNSDGRVTHYLAIKEDITQFKRTQEEVRASRENLHRLLNSMTEGAYGVDINGHCTFVNHAFLQILGYQNEAEVLGKNTHELIHHSHADGRPYPVSECKAYHAYRANQAINIADEVFWRKDGVAILVEYWSHPILTDGVVTGAITTFVDITERKRVEITLKNMAAKFHTLFEMSSDAIMLLDEKGFFDCNEAALRLFGYTSRDEFISRHPAEYSPSSQPGGEDSLSLANEHIATAVRLGSNLFEWIHRRQDGSEFPAEVLLNALVLDGKSVLQATVRDITERKRVEAFLREKEILLSESQRIAHVGSWRFDLTGQLTWSDETYRIYGVTPDTFAPNIESLIKLIHPADRLAMQAWIGDCIAGKNPEELEFRILPPDGTERVISGFGELQYDASNRPSHLIGIVHDITEHKQSETKLSEQMDELRRWNDVTSGREGRILELKHEVNELLGQTGKHPRYPSAESQDQKKE